MFVGPFFVSMKSGYADKLHRERLGKDLRPRQAGEEHFD